MKHSSPFIAEGVAAMRADGIDRAVGLVLAPHWSGMSVDTYVERVEKAVAETGAGPAFTFIRHWYDHPLFLDLLAARVTDAMNHLSPAVRERAGVIFSAHSLPTRALADGSQRCKLCTAPSCQAWCGYVEQLQDTANRVAGRLGLRSFAIGWQSAGRTDDPWWGPSVEEVIRSLAGNGSTAVVCCSAGFVANHLEVLYDLDIEARQVAERAGLAFVRTEMPNDDPAFIRALAAVVREAG
jgi:ferrochelatase